MEALPLEVVLGTPEWWDHQLTHHWERNGGPAQTRHFMERLVAHLEPPELTALRAGPVTMLDWGCAMGEGVAVLAEAFPGAAVAGLDIAPSAIAAARRRHPGREFLVTSGGEIPRAFDVVVSSNCLEHFADPWPVMAAHLAACRSLYAALVPHRELPRLVGHETSFDAESFPLCMAGWVRLSVRVVTVEPRYWYGEQLLVVYGSRAHLASRPAQATDGEWWPAYLAANAGTRRVVDALALERARAATRAWEAEAALAGAIASADPKAAIEARALATRLRELEADLAALLRELDAIVRSRAWRLAQELWRWRRLLAPPSSGRDRLLRRMLDALPSRG